MPYEIKVKLVFHEILWKKNFSVSSSAFSEYLQAKILKIFPLGANHGDGLCTVCRCMCQYTEENSGYVMDTKLMIENIFKNWNTLKKVSLGQFYMLRHKIKKHAKV